MYLIDTDVLIEILRGKKKHLKEKIENIGDDITLYTTSINVAELYFGAHLTKNFTQQKEKVDKLLQYFEVLNYSIYAAQIFADIKYELKRKNILIPDTDLFIASTCMENELIFVTHNTKHFNRIKKLKIESWY